jgi:hypothetical protein
MLSRSIDLTRVSARFDAALDSLAAIGLTEMRDPNRLDVSNLPRPDMLARLLSEISSVWREQRGEVTHRAAAVQEIDSPEALVSHLQRSMISMSFLKTAWSRRCRPKTCRR